jgi:Outer membrane protein beta-barrel domain
MKRIFGILLTLVLVPCVTSPARAEMALGLKGGVSLSHVNADLFDTQNRTGFVGGVYGTFDLSPMFGVQPELLFVRKGAKLFSTNVTIGGITFGTVGSTLDVDYIEIPLLFRLSAPSPGPIDLRLLAGPVASIKMNEQISTTGLIGISLNSDQVKTSDFGLAVGGAAAIQNGTMKVVAEGRYTFGLSNISDLPFGGDVKNGAFYAMLGLEFPFGGP